MSLIMPHEGVAIHGLRIPEQFYWVLTKPAPLAGMKLPRDDCPWASIAQAGFQGVVALHRAEKYDPSPLQLIYSESLEDLANGKPPRDPSREQALIQNAVTTTHSALAAGKGVVIHCWGGRGRTGTVLGCVLRELGYPADTIVNYLDQIHKQRGKDGWPESDWQSEQVFSWVKC